VQNARHRQQTPCFALFYHRQAACPCPCRGREAYRAYLFLLPRSSCCAATYAMCSQTNTSPYEGKVSCRRFIYQQFFDRGHPLYVFYLIGDALLSACSSGHSSLNAMPVNGAPYNPSGRLVKSAIADEAVRRQAFQTPSCYYHLP
jgi:hypothetical protein